jgi:DNA-binding transcriptional regulator GbsR (MarR family)
MGRLRRILTDTERGHWRHPTGHLDRAPSAGVQGPDPGVAADEAAAAGAGARDPVAVRAFIEGFTSLLTQAGFPRTPARIFVALLTSDSSRLTAADLAELLQTSPASVSGGVRYLVQVGLVTAEGEPGSRRQHYRMPTDVWDEIVRLRNRQFARWVAELREGVGALGAATPAGSRMASTVRYFDFLSTEMSGLLSRWQDLEERANAESAGWREDR